ncbi:hypothetical protein SAMN04490244_110124 [Tranquillimonas rosea]|uniref:Histidine kinase n=1 Tax=Tranquillimonas rosea TaxID=641238 RepID=A0A1H9WEZ8_9RHOB|nr:DUF6446 family protein [Tranquillimonas rosea]SES32361.1 hypothetical protein SAMN04490244_110124 [Tranquillimonas rosea]
MTGKIVTLLIVAVALAAGGLMYWLQVYYYYETLGPEDAAITLVPQEADDPRPVDVAEFQGIDANSSPLRYRACFTLPDPDGLRDTYEVYPAPIPLTAPSWFDCFDAEAVGEALERDEARAYLAERNIEYGVDRVVAVFPDGRAYAWHQLNNCGETDYTGTPVTEECPPRPD